MIAAVVMTTKNGTKSPKLFKIHAFMTVHYTYISADDRRTVKCWLRIPSG